MSKWKVGDSIHINHKSGGGQLAEVVGVNEKFLFVSWEARYGNYDGAAQVQVIHKDSARISDNPEKHICNCEYCERPPLPKETQGGKTL